MAAAVAGAPRGASAQNLLAGNGRGMDTHLFRPAMDSKGLFSRNGSDILGKNDISFGLVLDYGNTLLRVPSLGQATPELIEHSFQGTLQFNYGLANLFVVGLDIPVDLMTGDAQVQANGTSRCSRTQWGTTQLNSQNLGFLAAHAKWRILRVEKGLGLALGVQVGGSPTSTPPERRRRPGLLVLAAGHRRAPLRAAPVSVKIDLNGGFRGHTASGTTLNLSNGTYVDGNLVTFGGGIAVRVLDPLELVGETYGTYLPSAGSVSGVRLSNEAVGGIKLFVERNSYLMMGAGAGYTDGLRGREHPRVHRLHLRAVDRRPRRRRHQGRRRQVPGRAGGLRRLPGRRRLPRPGQRQRRHPRHQRPLPQRARGPRRRPGRGRLPREAATATATATASSTRTTSARTSRRTSDGFQDDDGCPDPDNDKDGIPDKLDKCPNDPEDKDGFEDADGCPDPDNDKDGIPDVIDKCPNEPETFNGYQDEDGCPDKGSVIIQDNNIVILEKIKFKTGSRRDPPRVDARSSTPSPPPSRTTPSSCSSRSRATPTSAATTLRTCT